MINVLINGLTVELHCYELEYVCFMCRFTVRYNLCCRYLYHVCYVHSD